ncbi:MAG: hypothetical protein IKB02_03370 [Clostridia bacterium]|nr:hypothetical protein [Clostridia bacterium]
MSNFKRFILTLTSIVLALVMLLSVGCTNDAGNNDDDENNNGSGEQLEVIPDTKDPFSVNSWSDLKV